jgi:hypothetical protein
MAQEGFGIPAMPSGQFLSPNEQPAPAVQTPALALDNQGQPNTALDKEESDRKALVLVTRLFEEGKKAKADVSSKWDQYENFYNGKQWDQPRPAYRASTVINIIRPDIQTVIPIMTDADPGFEIGPREPGDFAFAKTLNELCAYWWDQRSMSHTLIGVLMDQSIFDAGVMKVIWNKDLEDGSGDVQAEPVSPRFIYVPKDALDFDKNCPWVIHEIWKPLGSVKRQHPELADKMQGAGTDSPSTSPSGGNVGRDTTVTLISPVDKRLQLGSTPSSVTGNDDNANVQILELWLDDYATEEAEDEDNPGKKIVKKKYPNGRLIQVMPGRKLVLFDGANPYSDGKKPFVRFIDTIKARSFWGEGMVGPKLEVQRIVNKIVANIMDYMTLMSNPVWILDNGSGVDPDKITNAIGLVIEKERNTEVRRDIPPPLPAYYFQFYQTMMSFGESVNGVHEVTQGRKPAGVTAAEAINTLQDAAQTRIRLKDRNMEVSLSQLARLVVSRFMQYYTNPRVIKIAGQAAEWPTYFEFYIAPTDDGKYQMASRQYVANETGAVVPSNTWNKSSPSRGAFDINVVTGTSLPMQKARMGDLALKLYQMQPPINDAADVLDKLQYPNKDELMTRMDQAKQAAATAQGAPPTGTQVAPGSAPGMPAPSIAPTPGNVGG